jgi:hypothetical protein
MVKGQVSVPDSLASKSDMIKSVENLINSIICLFQYIKSKDSTFQIKSKNYYIAGDSLYNKFYTEHKNITLDRNYSTMIEGTIQQVRIYTAAKDIHINDKYGLVYYKLNNTTFGVSPQNGTGIIGYFALSQEDVYIILKSEIKRIENKD